MVERVLVGGAALALAMACSSGGSESDGGGGAAGATAGAGGMTTGSGGSGGSGGATGGSSGAGTGGTGGGGAGTGGTAGGSAGSGAGGTSGAATGGSGGSGVPVGPGPGSSDTYEEVGGLVAVEAEHFSSHDDGGTPRAWYLWGSGANPNVTPDPDDDHSDSASGGEYLEGLPDTRVTHDDPIQNGESIFNNAGAGPTLSYRVYFNTPGTYFVWVRAYSTGTEDNGIHVGINGDWPTSGERLQFCSGKNQWTWSSNKRDSGGTACGEPNTITIDVPSAGEHTIEFSMREDGFEFDKWIMTQDGSFSPNGSGPDERVRAN